MYITLQFISSVLAVWPDVRNTQTQDSLSLDLCKFQLLKSQMSELSSKLVENAFIRASTTWARTVTCENSSNSTIIDVIVNDSEKRTIDLLQDGPGIESYSLVVSKDGIKIEAESVVAVMRAAWTVFQLANGTIINTGLRITDSPSLVYRGLFLDTTRSQSDTKGERHSIETLFNLIDRMEVIKMNVLQWHLADTDGSSISINGISADDPYTADDFIDLYQYGYERGVLVVPDIDLAGHSGKRWADQSGISNLSTLECPNQLNINSNDASDFGINFYTEMINSYFQKSAFIGVGNDVKPCGSEYNSNFVKYNRKLTELAISKKKVLIVNPTASYQKIGDYNNKVHILMPTVGKIGEFNDTISQINFLQGLGFAVINGLTDWQITQSSNLADLYKINPLGGITLGTLFGATASIIKPSIKDLSNVDSYVDKLAAIAEQLWIGRGGEINTSRLDSIKKLASNFPVQPIRSRPSKTNTTLIIGLSVTIIILVSSIGLFYWFRKPLMKWFKKRKQDKQDELPTYKIKKKEKEYVSKLDPGKSYKKDSKKSKTGGWLDGFKRQPIKHTTKQDSIYSDIPTTQPKEPTSTTERGWLKTPTWLVDQTNWFKETEIPEIQEYERKRSLKTTDSDILTISIPSSSSLPRSDSLSRSGNVAHKPSTPIVLSPAQDESFFTFWASKGKQVETSTKSSKEKKSIPKRKNSRVIDKDSERVKEKKSIKEGILVPQSSSRKGSVPIITQTRKPTISKEPKYQSASRTRSKGIKVVQENKTTLIRPRKSSKGQIEVLPNMKSTLQRVKESKVKESKVSSLREKFEGGGSGTRDETTKPSKKVVVNDTNKTKRVVDHSSDTKVVKDTNKTKRVVDHSSVSRKPRKESNASKTPSPIKEEPGWLNTWFK